jgi:hypothetical protein
LQLLQQHPSLLLLMMSQSHLQQQQREQHDVSRTATAGSAADLAAGAAARVAAGGVLCHLGWLGSWLLLVLLQRQHLRQLHRHHPLMLLLLLLRVRRLGW